MWVGTDQLSLEIGITTLTIWLEIQVILEEAERDIQTCKGLINEYENDANDCEERLGLLKKEGERRT